jgi:hypothetical protein
VDKSKIYLMGSFHPSHISIANFVKKTQSLLDSGWKIGFVNYMMTSEQAEGFFEASKELSKIGIPLNPNPLVGATISSKQNQAIQQYLEETDYYFKMGNSAKGKICLYPTLSYEMTPTGYVKAGCAPANHGNIFSNKPLPKLPMNPIKCPFSSCLCLSQYSFVKGNDRNKGLNTVKQYSNDLRKKYGLPFI